MPRYWRKRLGSDLPPIAVAVLDNGGHLKALQRQDGLSFLRADICQAKAWGALALGTDTRDLAERFARTCSSRDSCRRSMPCRPAALSRLPGGVLIRDDGGRIVGAIGVAGARSEQDEACALAAVRGLACRPDMTETRPQDPRPLQGMRIGFAGLGLMGRPMALHLLEAGADLCVWNRSRDVAERLLRPGMQICDTPADLGRASAIVVLMVADTHAVDQVLFGNQGLAQGLDAGDLVVDMGTTSVMATRDFAGRLSQAGVDFVDAPVSGGEIGAVDASLTIMAGGDDAVIARARPLFDVLGRQFTHVGAVGAGQVAKAANQIIVGLNIGAVAEALALVKAAGVDPRKVRQALLGGFAGSRILGCTVSA